MAGWIDGHLDLAYLAVGGRDLRERCADPATGCVSLPDLREAPVEIAFATIFTAPGDDGPAGYPGPDDLDAAEAAGLRQLEIYEALERQDALTIVRTRADLDRGAERPAIILLVEGADPIRTPDDVARWRERGVRLVGLTWAAGTRYAGGNASGGPLTALGVEMIAALDAAGIVHDASHLSDAAFDGVFEHAQGPIVATHSNCRALMGPDERHLRDDQIAVIGARGGIVGLNLYTRFLATDRRATIDDCVAHVEHVASVCGDRGVVALGSDMDGGFGPESLPEGLDHPRHFERLADALRDAGWSRDDVAGFAHGNWRRVIGEAIV